MVAKVNRAGLEAGSHEQRPKVPLVVIHFVVVHLDLRAETETERREFQKAFPQPRRDIDEQHARRFEQGPGGFNDKKRIAQMLQHRDKHHCVETFIRQFWQRLFDASFVKGKFLERSEFRSDVKIHSDAVLQTRSEGHELGGAKSATQLNYLQIRSIRQMSCDGPLRQPDACAIQKRQVLLAVSLVRPRAQIPRFGATRCAISSKSVKQKV